MLILPVSSCTDIGYGTLRSVSLNIGIISYLATICWFLVSLSLLSL